MPDLPLQHLDDVNDLNYPPLKASKILCWPKKPITLTVVRCKDHQPIILFTLSQPTTGEIFQTNNGTNIARPCVLPGDSIRISANGYTFMDVVVPDSAVSNGLLEVCLDEVRVTVEESPPKDPRQCGIIGLLGVSAEPNASRFANVLRGFRDILLGTPGGRILVDHYYNESVQKELITRLAKPTRVIEVLRLLVEATPFIMEFVEPRKKAFGTSCCGSRVVLDEHIVKGILKLVSSLKKEVEVSEMQDALAFVGRVVEQSANKAPGQVLDILAQSSSKNVG